METAAANQDQPLPGHDFARLRLLKGADLNNIESLLEECPVFPLKQDETLSKGKMSEYSLLVLLSGQLESQENSPGVAKTVTAGEYIGGLNPVLAWSQLSNYRAIQESRVMAFDDEMLQSLAMVSHSAAVNLSALAMEQLKHLPAANDAPPVRSTGAPVDEAAAASRSLPAPKLHDAKWLEELLDRQIIRSLTDREPLSLAVLEIDGVSDYLEKHGEEALDYISNSVAHSILDNVRPGDLVAKIDEVHFVVVLPRAGAEDSFRPAERLVENISKNEVEIPDDCTLPPVTVSIGLAQLKAMVGAEKFVAEGIEALERAKQNGPCSISA